MTNIILTKIIGVDTTGNKICRYYDTELGQFFEAKYPPLFVQALMDHGYFVPLSAAEERLLLKSGKVFLNARSLKNGLISLKTEQMFKDADYALMRAMRGAGVKNPEAFSKAVIAREEFGNQDRYDDSLDIIISFRNRL